MKKSDFILQTVLAGTLFAAAPTLPADKSHDHSHHEHHHASDTAMNGMTQSTHEGMTSLYRHLGELEKELAAGNLNAIHNHDAGIQAAVKGLDQDTTLTADKRKRVQGYVKTMVRLSSRLHSSADEKLLGAARKDLPKLQATVDLLDKQFAHSHKSGAAGKSREAGRQDNAEK